MRTSDAEAARLRAGRDGAVAEAAVLAAKLEAAEDMLRHAMGAGDADWDGWLMAHDGLCDWYRGARAGADGAARDAPYTAAVAKEEAAFVRGVHPAQGYVAWLNRELEEQRRRADDAVRGLLDAGMYVSRASHECEVADLSGELQRERASREHWQRVASGHAAKVRELEEENEALREWRACYEIARAELDELYEARGLPGGVEWPRFEDGEPVGFGDAVANPMMYGPPHELEDTVWRVVLDGDGWHIVGRSSTHIVQDGEYGARVQRPHLLASDGLPIEVGQTLYGESDGKAWVVEGFDRKRPWSVRAHDALDASRRRDLKPEWLTHEMPDSWERIMGDLRNIGTYSFPADIRRVPNDEIQRIAERIERLAGKGAL